MARPTYTPTKVDRRKVANAAGGGMAHEEIAIALGISRNTLEKHFADELSTGAYQKRLEVLDSMQRAAKRGNVAAQKAYLQTTPRLAAPPASAAADDQAKAKAPEGKKAQANAAAVTAGVGTEWESILKPTSTPLQ